MVLRSCHSDKSIDVGAMDGLQLALDFGKGAIATMERQLERADHRLIELEGLLSSSQLGAITGLLGHCGYTR